MNKSAFTAAVAGLSVTAMAAGLATAGAADLPYGGRQPYTVKPAAEFLQLGRAVSRRQPRL